MHKWLPIRNETSILKIQLQLRASYTHFVKINLKVKVFFCVQRSDFSSDWMWRSINFCSFHKMLLRLFLFSRWKCLGWLLSFILAGFWTLTRNQRCTLRRPFNSYYYYNFFIYFFFHLHSVNTFYACFE